jgi:hypothetical protein
LHFRLILWAIDLLQSKRTVYPTEAVSMARTSFSDTCGGF